MIELPLFHNRKTGKPIRVRLTGHVLLSGSTGSGKSGAMLHIVHCISKLSSSRDKLTILDYKGSKDWKELRGVRGYYSVEESKEGFEQAYLLFREQLEGGSLIGDNIHWLVIEEMASLVESYTSKAEKAVFFQRFGEMLRLSRNIGDGEGGWRIIVTMQQPDSSFLGGTQNRSNFGLRICVGGISAEGKRMLFERQDDDPTEVSSSATGKGFAQQYGGHIIPIIFPYEKRRELVFSRVITMLER